MRLEGLFIVTRSEFLFEGTGVFVEQLGEVQLVYVDIGRTDLPLVTQLAGNIEVKRGAAVGLNANPDDPHIFDTGGRSMLRRHGRGRIERWAG